MALYNIYVQDEQKEFLNTLFKFSFIVLVFHILMCISYPEINHLILECVEIYLMKTF